MKTWILDENMDAANEAAMLDAARFDAQRQACDRVTVTAEVESVKPVRPVMDDDDVVAALRAEILRLRAACLEALPFVLDGQLVSHQNSPRDPRQVSRESVAVEIRHVTGGAA